MKTLLLPLVLAGLANAATAQETRELGAHEHGHSRLDIAFDGTSISLELAAPGADIVGFEYAATSAEDLAKVDDAVVTLSDPMALFVLPEDAGCIVTETEVNLATEHDDHDDEEHPEEDHAAEGHASEDHADEAGHSEFKASYMLICSDTAAIDNITFGFFDIFSNAQELDIQMISGKGSAGFEVTRDTPMLDLTGQI
jgi:hypothetical protein